MLTTMRSNQPTGASSSYKTCDSNKNPLQFGCRDNWNWDKSEKSHEVRIYGAQRLTAHFHPNWSNGTAGVRGTRALNRGSAARYYWEVQVSDRIFGTSMMFGVATKKSRLHADSFVNMLGEDDQGWGLSHKGLLWHNGQWLSFTKPFKENEATTVGILFDSVQGSLTFYKDGTCLGVAFSGLHEVRDKLFPAICSTAAKTEMTLNNMRRDYYSLQDRCRDVIVNNMRSPEDVNSLQLPVPLQNFLQNTTPEDSSNDSEADMDIDFLDTDSWSQIKNSMRSQFSENGCGLSRSLTRSMGQPSQIPPYPQY